MDDVKTWRFDKFGIIIDISLANELWYYAINDVKNTIYFSINVASKSPEVNALKIIIGPLKILIALY
jgi:hypothetical protein